jgi:hypothetical protein
MVREQVIRKRLKFRANVVCLVAEKPLDGDRPPTLGAEAVFAIEPQPGHAIVIGAPAQSAQTFWAFMNPVRNTLRPHSGQGCGVRIA